MAETWNDCLGGQAQQDVHARRHLPSAPTQRTGRSCRRRRSDDERALPTVVNTRLFNPVFPVRFTNRSTRDKPEVLRGLKRGFGGVRDARNVRLVAQTDLNGHGDGCQVCAVDGFAYVGHMGESRVGTSILDVSDPADPLLVCQLTTAPGTHSHKVQVVDGGQLRAQPARARCAELGSRPLDVLHISPRPPSAPRLRSHSGQAGASANLLRGNHQRPASCARQTCLIPVPASLLGQTYGCPITLSRNCRAGGGGHAQGDV